MSADKFQIKRGSTSAVSAYTPLAGEFVLDTQLIQLRIGDGSTVGGRLIGSLLSPFMASVLDDANQAAVQTTLGLVPTATQVDTTAGRLLKIGDFGIGLSATDQSPSSSDANTAVTPGAYRMSSGGANKPMSAGGVLVVAKGFAATIQQQFTTAATSDLWVRTSPDTGATWTTWEMKQASTAGLAAIATLTPAANQIVRYTSATAATLQSFTTGAQALAALTYATDRIGYTTSASAAAVTPLTPFGRSLIDDADAATARTTLGVLAQTDKPSWASFTPAVTAQTGTYTTVSATGNYIVEFGQCFFTAQVTVTTKGTGVNPIVSLPVAARALCANMPMAAVKEGALTGKLGVGVVNTGLTNIVCVDYSGADLITGNGAIIYISGNYPVA